MKFAVSKKKLAEAVDKISCLAMSPVRSNYDNGGAITIEVKDNVVNFWTSNGHTSAKFCISDGLDCVNGIATVNASMCKKIISAIGKDDDNITVTKKKTNVHVKNDTKKLRMVKMPTNGTDHVGELADKSLKIVVPSKFLFKHEFECNVFLDGITKSTPYKDIRNFETELLQVLMHIFPDRTRFICGNGSRFVILSYADECKSVDEEGFECLIPADEALLLTQMMDLDKKNITLTYKDKKTCFIESGDLTVKMNMPEAEYIKYADHAYQYTDGDAIDIDWQEFKESVDIVRAVRDKDLEKTNGYHSAYFTYKPKPNESLTLFVEEDSYQCKIEGEAVDSSREEEFLSSYSAEYLADVVKACDKGHLRFWVKAPTGTVVVEPVNLQNSRDKQGRRTVEKDSSFPEPHLLIFFSPAAREDEEE